MGGSLPRARIGKSQRPIADMISLPSVRVIEYARDESIENVIEQIASKRCWIYREFKISRWELNDNPAAGSWGIPGA